MRGPGVRPTKGMAPMRRRWSGRPGGGKLSVAGHNLRERSSTCGLERVRNVEGFVQQRMLTRANPQEQGESAEVSEVHPTERQVDRLWKRTHAPMY